LDPRDQVGRGGGFTWHEKVSDYATGEASPVVAGMYPRQLDVRVSWVDGTHEREVTLTSVRLSSDGQ